MDPVSLLIALFVVLVASLIVRHTEMKEPFKMICYYIIGGVTVLILLVFAIPYLRMLAAS